MTFPQPREIDPDHPSADVLLWAYSQGLFPMAESRRGGEIAWFCPDPRAVLPLDERFHVPRSLARIVRSPRFRITSDTAFERIIRACAEPRPYETQTWIGEELIPAYVELNRIGHAHSVEAWRDDRLVGGLYGVHIGAAFFGESMFSDPARGGADSSKVCLIHLVEHLRRRRFTLLDTQFANPHMDQFGTIEMPRDEYLARLAAAVKNDVEWKWGDGEA